MGQRGRRLCFPGKEVQTHLGCRETIFGLFLIGVWRRAVVRERREAATTLLLSEGARSHLGCRILLFLVITGNSARLMMQPSSAWHSVQCS
jgi:hypothetical protein